MKKLIALTLSLSLCFTLLTACGGGTDGGDTGSGGDGGDIDAGGDASDAIEASEQGAPGEADAA